MIQIWEVAISAAGLSAVGLIVYFYLVRRVIPRAEFPRLTRKQATLILVLFLAFTWSLALAAIIVTNWSTLAGRDTAESPPLDTRSLAEVVKEILQSQAEPVPAPASFPTLYALTDSMIAGLHQKEPPSPRLEEIIKRHPTLLRSDATSPGDKSRIIVGRATRMILDKRYQDAIDVVRGADVPLDQEAVAWIEATAYKGLEDWGQAIPTFERLLKLAPEDLAAQADFARVLMNSGHLERALKMLDQLVAVHRDIAVGADSPRTRASLVGVLSDRAQLHTFLDEPERSIMDLNAALDIAQRTESANQPDEVKQYILALHVQRCVVHRQTGDLAASREDRRIATALLLESPPPDNRRALKLAAALLYNQSVEAARVRNLDDAIRDMEYSRKAYRELADIRWPTASLGLADALYALGRTEAMRERYVEARGHYEACIAFAQSGRTELGFPRGRRILADALLGLGMSEADDGKLGAAAEHLGAAADLYRRLVATRPRSGTLRHLAMSLFYRGVVVGQVGQDSESAYTELIALRNVIKETSPLDRTSLKYVAFAYINRSELYMSRTDPEKADADLASAEGQLSGLLDGEKDPLHVRKYLRQVEAQRKELKKQLEKAGSGDSDR